jgi:hypothetical protein
MKRLIIAAAALLTISAMPAFAQSPDAKIKLEITRAELGVIGQCLMELPYKTAAQIMADLQAQLIAADQAAAKAAEDAKAKANADKPKDAAAGNAKQ